MFIVGKNFFFGYGFATLWVFGVRKSIANSTPFRFLPELVNPAAPLNHHSKQSHRNHHAVVVRAFTIPRWHWWWMWCLPLPSNELHAHYLLSSLKLEFHNEAILQFHRLVQNTVAVWPAALSWDAAARPGFTGNQPLPLSFPCVKWYVTFHNAILHAFSMMDFSMMLNRHSGLINTKNTWSFPAQGKSFRWIQESCLLKSESVCRQFSWYTASLNSECCCPADNRYGKTECRNPYIVKLALQYAQAHDVCRFLYNRWCALAENVFAVTHDWTLKILLAFPYQITLTNFSSSIVFAVRLASTALYSTGITF